MRSAERPSGERAHFASCCSTLEGIICEEESMCGRKEVASEFGTIDRTVSRDSRRCAGRETVPDEEVEVEEAMIRARTWDFVAHGLSSHLAVPHRFNSTAGQISCHITDMYV